MKAIKNWEYLQVVCADQNEVLKALTTYPRFAFEKKWVGNEILNYFANTVDASEIAGKFNLDEEKTKEILWYAQREWDDALIDEEGATLEQDLALDLVIKRAVEALEEIKKESN